jgi:tRNA threonylcarbamoyl adenosine modification protein (Sua5/YciO/YrdC/YwlC family)
METKVKKISPDREGQAAILEAAACLASGGLVVFPTETVYGVGACATNPEAMARLREVKGRNGGKPFTVHIGSRSNVTRFVPELHGVGHRLTEKAWPGPLTLIFQVNNVEAAPVIQETSVEHAPAMYYEGTIGIRCPDDRVAADVLNHAAVPIVAASANFAGEPAAVTAEEAIACLNGQVDFILDAGRTLYARASTVVRVNTDGYHILREGVLDERTIRRLTKTNFLVVCSGNTCRSPMAEGLLRHILAERIGCSEQELEERGFHVESAGISASYGLSPSPQAIEAMKARQIDISNHRSQPITLEQIHRADYIFAMTEAHLQGLSSFTAAARDRAKRIDEVGDIEDPIGADESVYAECAAQLEKAIRRRIEEVPL